MGLENSLIITHLIITHLLNKTLCDFLFCLFQCHVFQCHVWAKSLLIGNFVLNILLPIRLLLDQFVIYLFIFWCLWQLLELQLKMPRYDDRYGNTTRLYVGHLSSRTRARDLEHIFSRYGRYPSSLSWWPVIDFRIFFTVLKCHFKICCLIFIILGSSYLYLMWYIH